MNLSYPNAAGGLKMLFLAQILVIVGTVVVVVSAILSLVTFGALAMLALLGSIVTIIATVVEILGLSKAGQDDEGYRTALVFCIAALVVSVINSMFLSDVPFVGTLLSLVITVLNFLAVNSVCQTTGNLLHSMGSEALAQQGTTVIKIYFACTAIEVVCTVLSVVPILGALAGLVNGVAAIVSLVGYIMYLTFLNGSSNAL